VRLVEFGSNESRALREIAELAPDIVAYSICSNETARYSDINSRIRQATGCFSLFGGPHPTFFPDFIAERGVDAICRGEADRVFLPFLASFGTDRMYATENFSFRLPDGTISENPLCGLLEDLDCLPLPDRGLLYARSPFLALSPIKTFMAGRGCPFNCAYCFNHAYHALYRGKGAILRTKSVNSVLREISSIVTEYPFTFAKFHDDVFGADRTWLTEFAERFPREVGAPFCCLVNPMMVTDDYAALLSRAGCSSVSVAIESGDENRRREILNRPGDNATIIAACRRLKAYGMRVNTLNMVGLPGETNADIMQTVELNRRAGADYADATVFQPYPGTPIMDYCRDHGLLDQHHAEFHGHFSEPVLKISPEQKADIMTARAMFAMMVDHPSLARLLPFLSRLRHAHRLLDLLYRVYYGYFLHKRIYRGAIPLSVRMRAMSSLLLSKSRG
jgi:radical SAM superfamily enzyme YgiQ (UPF0313 family)